MGKRGPKPEPTALKMVKGNPGGRKLNDDEPKPKKVSGDWETTPPLPLDGDALEHYLRLFPVLEGCGILTEADVVLFARYCREYGLYRQAVRELEKKIETHGGLTFQRTSREGDRYDTPHPEIRLVQQFSTTLKQMEGELGLTPSSRSSLGVNKPVGPSKKGDPLKEKFFGKR